MFTLEFEAGDKVNNFDQKVFDEIWISLLKFLFGEIGEEGHHISMKEQLEC